MIKIAIVDDHDLVRTAIARMLNDMPGLSVIWDATTGDDALHLARRDTPDVVLMDIRMPGMDGLETSQRLLRIDDGIRIIVLTMCVEEPFPSRLLKAGVSGYMTKGASPDEMLRAIKVVMSGQRYISQDVAQSMALNPYKGDRSLKLDQLSQRELQIMLLIVNCHKVNDVADQLCLSPKTVNTYRYRIFDKLGITSDLEMALIAIRYGLVDVNETSAIL